MVPTPAKSHIAALIGLLLLIASPALSQPNKLELLGQDTRLRQRLAVPEGLDLLVEVRDRCGTVVKKEDVKLNCSDWRPFLPVDIERQPFFKGDITTPSGEEATLLGRKGPKLSGETHEVELSIAGGVDGVPGPLSWPLEHVDAQPGTWRLAAPELGRVLVHTGKGGLDASWDLVVAARTNGAKTRWKIDAVTGTWARERPGQLSPEVRKPVDLTWRCQKLEPWTEEAVLLDLVDGGSSSAELALRDLIYSVDATAGTCGTTSGTARAQVCELTPAVAEAVLRGEGDSAVVGQLLPFCPAESDAVIHGAVAGRFDELLGLEDLAQAGSHVALWKDSGAEGWLESARVGLEALAAKSFDPLVEAGEVAPVTEFIETYREALSAEWAAAAVTQRATMIQSQLDSAIEEKDISGVTAVIAAHGELMTAEWLDIASGERAALLGEAWSAATKKDKIPVLITLLTEHGPAMGFDWETASRTDIQARIQARVDQTLVAVDGLALIGIVEAFEAFSGPEWGATNRELALTLGHGHIEQFLTTEDTDGAEAWADEAAGKFGGPWRAQVDQRLGAFEQEIASGPPLMVTFVEDGKKCRLDIVRPASPPRTVQSLPWSSACKDLWSVAISGNKIIVHSSTHSRGKTKRRIKSFDMKTGKGSKLPSLPRPNDLVRVGFDASGNVLAVGRLTNELRKSEDDYEYWLEWEGQKYSAEDGGYCESTLMRSYRKSGSSWKTVHTNTVENCGGTVYEPDWGIHQSTLSCPDYCTNFGSQQDLRATFGQRPLIAGEAFGSRTISSLNRIAGVEAANWLVSSDPSPRISLGWETDEGHGDAYSIPPLLWERNGSFEVVPGEATGNWGTTFEKEGQYFAIRQGDQDNRLLIYDLTTHEVLWRGQGLFCPVWIR